MMKMGLMCLLASVSLLQAMDNTNYSSTSNEGYIVKKTGLGAKLQRQKSFMIRKWQQ